MPIKKGVKRKAAQTGPVKVESNAADIGDALDLCAKTVQNSRNAAVYKCVLMSASTKRLVIRGTDLLVYIERYVSVTADGDGVWLVPFEQMHHFVKNVQGKLTLQFTGRELTVVSYTSKGARSYTATIKLRDPREFTLWPKWDELKPAKVDIEKLLDAVRRSLNVESESGVDQTLQNISLKPYKNGFTDVQSSNNHRYQIHRLGMKLATGILIPLNSAGILAGLSDVKRVALRESMIGFETATSRVMSGLSSGDERYPKFAGLLPNEFVLTIELDKARMLQTTKLARGFADQKYRRMKVTVDPVTKTMLVESSVRSGGFKSLIRLKHCKGKPLSLLLDADDLEKFIGLCESDTFTMQFTGSGGQLLLRDSAQPKFWFATHPLIIRDEKEEEEESEPAEADK